MENKTYMIDIDNIFPYVNNCSFKTDKSIQMIKDSLVENGQIAPIVVNAPTHVFPGTRIICKGHGVYHAARELGWKEVLILEAEFKDVKHFMRYNIQDNSSAQFFEWNHDVLANLVDELEIDPVELGIDLKIDEPDLSGSSEGPEDIELCPTCGKKA